MSGDVESAASAPLIITDDVMQYLHQLRDIAGRHPVDVRELLRAIKTPTGKRLHMRQMRSQSMSIDGPWPFFVTFSIEFGHRTMTCRHMSMSVQRDGRLPSPQAVWMVARELGFKGTLETCRVWPERLGERIAINVVQPLTVVAAGHA